MDISLAISPRLPFLIYKFTLKTWQDMSFVLAQVSNKQIGILIFYYKETRHS